MEKVGDMIVYTNHQNIPVMLSTNYAKKNSRIVIKPSNKGSATVILSRNNYIPEVHRELNNFKYYKKLNKAIWPEN